MTAIVETCVGGSCIAVAVVGLAQGDTGSFGFLQYGALGVLALLILLGHRRDTKRDEALDANTKALVDMTKQIHEVVVATERVGEKRAQLASTLATDVKQAMKDHTQELREEIRGRPRRRK